MPLYDAHCHLHFTSLDAHRSAVAGAWVALDVAGAVVNGTKPDDWAAVAELARQDNRVRPAFGLHPWEVNTRPTGWLDALEAALESCPGATLGECGLDRWLRDADPPAQLECLEAQWDLAHRRNLPVTVHCLKAAEALRQFLANAPRLSRGFLLHAYAGPGDRVDAFLEAGAHFSFNLHLMQPKRAVARDTFRALPADRLLVETDAPAMPPPENLADYRLSSADGTPLNHPGNIGAAYRELIHLRNADPKELKATIAANFKRLFRD